MENAEAVRNYMENVGEIIVDGVKAIIERSGVKERNGEATLIYRYKLV